MNKWDKTIYAVFFFMVAVVGSLIGGATNFPKWIFIIIFIVIILYALNKNKISKNLRK